MGTCLDLSAMYPPLNFLPFENVFLVPKFITPLPGQPFKNQRGWNAFTTVLGFLKISPKVPTYNYLCLDSICSPILFPRTNIYLPISGFYLWILLVQRHPTNWNVCPPPLCSFTVLSSFTLFPPFPLLACFSQEWSLIWLIQLPCSRCLQSLSVRVPLCYILHSSRDWPNWTIEGTEETTDRGENLGSGSLCS